MMVGLFDWEVKLSSKKHTMSASGRAISLEVANTFSSCVISSSSRKKPLRGRQRSSK